MAMRDDHLADTIVHAASEVRYEFPSGPVPRCERIGARPHEGPHVGLKAGGGQFGRQLFSERMFGLEPELIALLGGVRQIRSGPPPQGHRNSLGPSAMNEVDNEASGREGRCRIHALTLPTVPSPVNTQCTAGVDGGWLQRR